MVMSSTALQCSTLAPQKGAPISSELMARHEGLVQWVVRRQYLGELSFADALHEGRIGLWHALVGYNPSRGTAFSSYAVPALSAAPSGAPWPLIASLRELPPTSRLQSSRSTRTSGLTLASFARGPGLWSMACQSVFGW